MDGERIRMSLELTVVAHPAGSPGPARAIPGQLVEYEDGRWLLWLAGAGPVRGDRAEGGREAVALLLSALANQEASPLVPPVLGRNSDRT